ncbi:hypothetical protein COY17_02250 [Candidatus Saccharibacteria bacterium CG_4_10_14_0_2_um_filter_52_9]|nr:MAG: hypothetical protein COY17_02250 [Candidatus Saccharibacteria bacterium CG_4_10_14_0_2_um_filter_52_9]
MDKFEQKPFSIDEPRELHICPACDSDFVYPDYWDILDGGQVELDLHCHQCEWTDTEVVSMETVERFDDAIGRSIKVIEDSLERMERTNMKAAVASFVSALETGLILPEDF